MPRLNNEAGSALIYVFIGVALFAALIFTFSRNSGNSSATMTSGQAKVLASDVIKYGDAMQRTVQRLIGKGCSENELNFVNPVVTGYTNAAAPSDFRCNIFHAAGGGMKWKVPMQGSNDASPWVISTNQVAQYDNTHNVGTSKEDLVLILPNMNYQVCAQIDLEVAGLNDIWEGAGTQSLTKFTGTFNDDPDDFGDMISTEYQHTYESSGCFCDVGPCATNLASPRYYLQVLHSR